MFKKIIEVPLPYGMCERCKQFELACSKLMADGQPYHTAYRCANEEFCEAIINNIDMKPAE
jgi:hypothetical protein